MTRYVMVPGYGGSTEGHWQLAWAEELGDRAVFTQPSSWDHPRLDDWIDAVDRAITAASEGTAEPVMLVAHSLGCWAVSAWCAQSRSEQVPSVMLVAPPDPASDAFPRADAATFLSLRAAPLHRGGAVVFSEDDPYCTPAATETFARDWGLKALNMGRHGHLNAASGLGTWDEGRRIRDGIEGGAMALSNSR